MSELDDSIAYFRGEFVPFSAANVSIASAPVLYGLAIYTVIPAFWNEAEHTMGLFRLKDHYRRLQNSCKILAFDDFMHSWSYAKFTTTIEQLMHKNGTREDSLIRVSVFVDETLKGTRMHGLKHSLSAFVYPMIPVLPETGAHLMVSSWRRTPDNAVPARAKINGSYANAALMKHEAVINGFDDAIALDEQGHVTESTVANIFLVRDGCLITPADSADILEGITRDSISRLAAERKMPQQQRAVDRSELYVADEIFLCGSSMNIVPVISVDHRQVGAGSVGPITKSLQKLYKESGHHRSPLFADWLTPVAPF